MSFESLQKTILDEAAMQAKQVKGEIEDQIESEKERISDLAHTIEDSVAQSAEMEGVMKARQIRQEAELDGRADVLRAKQEELETTKVALREKLLSADSDVLLKALLSLVPKESGTIVAGDVHAEQLRDLMPDGCSFAEKTIQNEGGFIFTSEHTELNVTISHLIDQLFITHRADIARELFS